jgi:hypothetical protein
MYFGTKNYLKNNRDHTIKKKKIKIKRGGVGSFLILSPSKILDKNSIENSVVNLIYQNIYKIASEFTSYFVACFLRKL